MTVSRGTTLLFSFRSKIEEAVSLVPRMHPEAKLKAVQFWNIVSEKLQDIVNNSAADISAVALKMNESNVCCSDKLSMEMNSSSNYIAAQNSVSTQDFMSLPSSYTVYESDAQFHQTDLSNNDLNHTLPDETVPLSAEEHHPSDKITSIPHDHHFNAVTDSSQDENQGVPDESQLLDIANIPTNPEDFSKDIQSTSEVSDIDMKASDRTTYEIPQDIEVTSNTILGVSPNDERTSIDNNANNNTNRSPESSSAFMTQTCCSESINRLNEIKKEKINFKNIIYNSDSCGGNGSDMDTDFYPSSCLDDSNEPTAERIVRCVSNIKKLLETDEDSRFHESKEDDRIQEDTKELSDTDDESPNTCKVCSKQFTDHEMLINHSSQHEKPYSCADCQATFSSKGNLAVHMRKHTGEKPYRCNECGSRFSTQGNLKRHVKTHSGEKPWKCGECGSCFTEKKSLTVHMRRHTGERPYECKICGKGFAQTGILQTHMSMHLDTKVHLCELCGKSFRQKSQLRIHRLRHDNVRKYGCDSCSAFFLTKGDLERHVRKHTGEKPFACNVCKKSFTRQQSLNEHLNRHYGIKPYGCKHCGKTFVEMSACYKHVKLHTDPGNIEGWRKNALKINHMDDELPRPEVTSEAGNTENELPSIQEGQQYYAVVLNPKSACENENNQTILFNPSSSDENGIVSSGLGVLTTLNLLANASTTVQPNF